MYQIVNREQFSDTTFLWDVFAPDVARSARPGQFIMLRLHEGGERIPLTVADYDRRRGTVTLVIQALGKTTRDMLTRYRAGDWFQDFVGPLGEETRIDSLQHVVLVGGGLGVAPVFPQLRAFKLAGARTTGIIGFRNRDFVFWEDKFREFCDELIVCTDDGSYGKAGFVTVALRELLEQGTRPDRVIAIGPLPMMKACADVTRPFEVDTWVSLNAIMVDGTGMCGSCRVTVGGEIKFACVDGPDFDAHKVDFPELMLRQERFRGLERKANDDYAHVCNLEKKLIEQGERNYKKLKEVTTTQRKMPERDALERSRNFREVNLGYTMADALLEAERCIQCKRPTCVAGCPVSVDIPGFIRHLLVRDLEGALAKINATNLFPSICGRVCPQEMQCESQCILAKKMEPVAIGRLERFVGDFAPQRDVTAVPRNPQMGRVAVVGSGPAGLAVAGDMARQGAEVVVFEALHVVGGVLRYGIPSFRLPRDIIRREVAALEKLGVRFEVNKVIGKTFTIDQLLKEQGFDAVFVGTGAGYPMFLGLKGEAAAQVYSANEFLTRVNLMGGNTFPFEDTPVNMGNRVVVIGAGNTAMDCLRVSKRMGAEHVHCVYRRSESEAPARIEEIRHAKEEGIQFHFLRSPLEIYTDDGGNVTGMKVQVMELGEPDASGRRRPVAVKGEIMEIECDTVIYALGTRANPIISRSAPDLALNKWGYIVADDRAQATNLPGVFAGGDIVTGGATVILALGAGRRAAQGITKWLQTRQWPPVLDEEAPATDQPGVNTCPRCHGPIEEGESYICCAGDSVSWRCTACQKVHEGFGFPFGLCPACGGRLAREGATEVSGSAATQAIRHAFEVELGGMAFYAKGAETAEDADLRELFLRLVQMERGHLDHLARRYHVTAPEPDAVDFGPAQMAVYAGLDPQVKTGEELLALALELERRARDFFAGQAHGLREGSTEWKLYRELEAEEYEHVAMIETELTRWRQGRAGIL